MTQSQEIKALNAQNVKISEEREGFPITGLNCTWVVLTSRIIRNEKRIEVLSKELGIRVGPSIL
jgi:hypothetical protein